MRARALRAGSLLALLALVLPGDVGAQNPAQRSERGWIGISFVPVVRGRLDGEGAPASTAVLVGQVYRGSPAAMAGLQPGDTLVTLNGAPATDRAFQRLDLRPGDTVRVTLRREGQEERVILVAAERPAPALVTVSPEQWVRIDSVRNAIVRFMEDSARVSLHSAPFFRVWSEGESGSGEAERFRILVSPDSEESFFPFSAFVARSEKTDSLVARMRGLQQELEEARRAELERQRELVEAMAREQRRIDQNDEELQRTRQLQEELRARLGETEELLARESRRELLARSARVDSVYRVRLDAVGQAPVTGTLRVSAPHMVGRSVVAGAQLLALNNGLADYFEADEGVLVVEVVPGSPAESAGILPGDVLVAVAGTPVRSVSDVRASVGAPARSPAGPLEVTLIRKGARVTVHLPR